MRKLRSSRCITNKISNYFWLLTPCFFRDICTSYTYNADKEVTGWCCLRRLDLVLEIWTDSRCICSSIHPAICLSIIYSFVSSTPAPGTILFQSAGVLGQNIRVDKNIISVIPTRGRHCALDSKRVTILAMELGKVSLFQAKSTGHIVLSRGMFQAEGTATEKVLGLGQP